MGEPGEPGSYSREVIRAALAAGLGVALCSPDCPADNSTQPGVRHNPECPVEQAQRCAAEILKSRRV